MLQFKRNDVCPKALKKRLAPEVGASLYILKSGN